MKIGILGHYGNGNLGDEAIIAAVVQSVRRYLPDAEIIGLSVNPEDTKRRHGITAFPIRRVISALPSHLNVAATPQETATLRPTRTDPLKETLRKVPILFPLLRGFNRVLMSRGEVWREVAFFRQSYRRMRDFDLLIIAGSGQLMDGFGGPWAFPFTLLKWSILARMRRAKLVFLSVGAGPINARLSRFFLRRALRLAHFRSYRDEYSRRLIEKIGVRSENHVYPDLACNLPLPTTSAATPPGTPTLVGIIPVPYYDRRYWQKNDPERYRNFIQKLVTFSLWLMDNGCAVSLFWTKLYTDELVVKEIKSEILKLRPNVPAELLCDRHITHLEDAIDAIAECDLLVACRFHGILLPLLMQRPVIGLAYHPKTDDMMAYMGQSHFCLSIDSFSVDDLKQLFAQVKGAAPKIREELVRHSEEVASQIEMQYREIFNL